MRGDKMNKKLLILGASHGDITLILAGKELGFKVITTGNNPSDLGHDYSDRYCYGDYSNYEEMLRLSKKLEVDAICATDDCSAITAAYLAEKLNLPGHDSYKTTLKSTTGYPARTPSSLASTIPFSTPGIY